MWVQQKHYQFVGAILVAARERADLTQQELARRLAKPQSFVSAYERGQRRVDVLELIRISEAVGADPTKVFAEIRKHSDGMRNRK